MTNTDVLCVGNVLIDAFLAIHEANLHCRIDQKACELCIKYGEKIPVDACQFLLGGNAANVSVGLSRLGVESALVAEIGDDEFAQKILKGLASEHINTSKLLQAKNTPSSFAIGLEFQNERTLFVSHVKRGHDFSFDGVVSQYMYLTSLGDEWRVAYANALAYVEKTQAKLVFNPGTHQLMGGLDALREIFTHTDILFLSLSEAMGLLTIKDESMQSVVKTLSSLGPKTVVVTDGDKGSYAYSDGKTYRLGILECEVIEKTGAGDAYASGFLSALVKGEDLQTAMKWGTVNAAFVIGKVGAQTGLLRREDMDEEVKLHTELEVEEVL